MYSPHSRKRSVTSTRRSSNSNDPYRLFRSKKDDGDESVEEEEEEEESLSSPSLTSRFAGTTTLGSSSWSSPPPSPSLSPSARDFVRRRRRESDSRNPLWFDADADADADADFASSSVLSSSDSNPSSAMKRLRHSHSSSLPRDSTMRPTPGAVPLLVNGGDALGGGSVGNVGRRRLLVELTDVVRVRPALLSADNVSFASRVASGAMANDGGGRGAEEEEEEEDSRAYTAIVSDGKDRVRAVVAGRLGGILDAVHSAASESLPPRRDDGSSAGFSFLFSVDGYVTSAANCANCRAAPFLYLSDGKMEEMRRFQPETADSADGGGATAPGAASSPATSSAESWYRPPAWRRVRGGNAGTFLARRAPFLSDAELVGLGSHPFWSDRPPSRNEPRRAAAAFLARHAAMMTLRSSSSPPPSPSPPAPTIAAESDASVSFADDADADADADATSPDTDDAGSSNYASALEEFATSQLERQEAGLTSNSGKEGAARSRLVIENHTRALLKALVHAERPDRPGLTPEDLLSWHGELCGGGLHSEAGTIRSKPVRAGVAKFCPTNRIGIELSELCAGLRSLESRLLWHALHPAVLPPRGGEEEKEGTLLSSSSSSSASNTGQGPQSRAGSLHSGDADADANANVRQLGPVLLAAAAMFGVVDVHPFADGNGRLSRIVANWALRRGGLPFAINVFATPAQRAEYMSALRSTMRNVSLIGRGTAASASHGDGKGTAAGASAAATEEEAVAVLLDAIRIAGAFGPIVDLLSDRIARSSSELRRSVALKSRARAAEMDDNAARRARERAAAGSCLICFERRPNVATLCCGQAVHINCIAQWLSSNTSCPQCRGDLPNLSARLTREEERRDGLRGVSDARSLVAAIVRTQLNLMGAEEDENGTSEDQDATEEEEQASSASATEEANESTTTDDEDNSTGHARHNAFRRSQGGENNDTTTSTNDDDEEAATTMSEEGSTSSETESRDSPQVTSQVLSCNQGGCYNKAAMDCTNSLCGRCCVIHGRFRCRRHNV